MSKVESKKEKKVHRIYVDGIFTACGRLVTNVSRKTMGHLGITCEDCKSNQ